MNDNTPEHHNLSYYLAKERKSSLYKIFSTLCFFATIIMTFYTDWILFHAESLFSFYNIIHVCVILGLAFLYIDLNFRRKNMIENCCFKIEKIDNEISRVLFFERPNTPSWEIRYYKNGVLHNDFGEAITDGEYTTHIQPEERFYLEGKKVNIKSVEELINLIKMKNIIQQF